VLDFGCGTGRKLRCFNHDQEVWGTEQNQESVFWCQQYLSPPFRFFTATSFPHLPFADEYFSLVYACSVFTHIPDLADAWLLELRRVLNPQGRLYVTVNDEHALRRIRDDPEGFLEDHPDRYSRDYMEFVKPWADKADDFGMIVIPSPGKPRGFWSNVLYSGEFIHRYWGQVLKIHSLTPWAYGFQTAVLMTKHDPAREVAPP